MKASRTPGSALTASTLALRHRPAEDRAFLEDGVEHAGHDDIDAEQRLAGHDPGIVDAGRPMADDLEGLRVLELDARRDRAPAAAPLWPPARHRRANARSSMMDDARLGAAFRRRHVPGLRRRGHEHLPPRGADAAQGIVVERRRHAAAGELLAVFGGIKRRLLDPHVLPFDVELLGDHHRQHRLDALADLGILRHDGDDAIGRDADEGVERRGFACVGRRSAIATVASGGSIACSNSPPPAAALAFRKERREGSGRMSTSGGGPSSAWRASWSS